MEKYYRKRSYGSKAVKVLEICKLAWMVHRLIFFHQKEGILRPSKMEKLHIFFI